ncbi:zinc finger transcription factor 1 [Apiospora marii]|uniref:Zinc finger transcription factor 1 n=1 Tax=Apiospora marii TaxID=335849 RepID=A0ABR1S5P1_9PEZI
MKHSSDGRRASENLDASAPTPETAASQLSPVALGKRRRNNPNECCDICRLRKVKCGGRTGDEPCDNCFRLKLACGFAQSTSGSRAQGMREREREPMLLDFHEDYQKITPTGTVTEAGTIRKRAQRACANCHRHKAKCSGDLPACSRCRSSSLTCEYAPSKRRFANVAAPPEPAEPDVSTTSVSVKEQQSPESQTPPTMEIAYDPSPDSQTTLLKRDIILQHMDVYFEAFWYVPCQGILHPATTYRLIEENSLPPYLAAAVVSITATMVTNISQGRLLAAQCNEQVEQYVMRKFGHMDPDLLVLQAFVTTYNWMSGPLSKVWMWTSTAARLARCLGLTHEPEYRPEEGGFARQESLRRAVWQVWIIDRYLSGGFEEHVLLPSSTMQLKLPCNDDVFRQGLPSTEATLHEPNQGDFSLNAAHIRLLNLRTQILSSMKRLSEALQNPQVPSPTSEHFMATVNHLQVLMVRFKDTLPDRVRLSPQSLQDHLNRPDRTSFLTLHLWVAQTYVDLYRFSLPRLADSTAPRYPEDIPWEWLDISQRQATAYAIHQAQFWTFQMHLIRQHSGVSKNLVTADWMIGACAVDCATVLLIARKYEIWKRALKEGSTAPLCLAKPIDDDLLSFLVSSLVSILETLKPFLPRVEAYQRHILAKEKIYLESGTVKESDSQLKSWVPSTKPEDIFSKQYEPAQNGVVEHDARSILQQSRPYPDGANRGSVSQDGSATGGGGVSGGDQPVMPYCLKRALDEPPVPPLSPPGSDETRSLQEMSNVATAPSTSTQQQQRDPGDDDIPSHLIRVDVSNWMKTEEPLISNLDTIAMSNYPALGLNTQFPFPAPTVTGDGVGGLGGGNGGGGAGAAAAASAGQYTMPYVIQDEDWRGLWPQNPQPMS